MSIFQLMDGTKVWYQIIGKGPLLVLNHGYGSSHANFDHIISFLKNDFTCLTWDNRGHGKSDKLIKDTYEQTAKIYSIAQFVDDLHELLLKLNLIDNNSEKIFMYGVSMGGLVSQMYAIKYENTLKALGLGATAPSFDHPTSKNQIFGKIPLSKNGNKMKAKLGFTKKFLKEYPEFIKKKIEKNFFILDDNLIIMPENFFGSFNVEKDLQKLSIPVIILHGENDEIMSMDKAKRFSELIPKNKFYSFPNVKHNINKEIPQLISEKLKHFFLKIN